MTLLYWYGQTHGDTQIHKHADTLRHTEMNKRRTQRNSHTGKSMTSTEWYKQTRGQRNTQRESIHRTSAHHLFTQHCVSDSIYLLIAFDLNAVDSESNKRQPKSTPLTTTASNTISSLDNEHKHWNPDESWVKSPFASCHVLLIATELGSLPFVRSLLNAGVSNNTTIWRRIKSSVSLIRITWKNITLTFHRTDNTRRQNGPGLRNFNLFLLKLKRCKQLMMVPLSHICIFIIGWVVWAGFKGSPHHTFLSVLLIDIYLHHYL